MVAQVIANFSKAIHYLKDSSLKNLSFNIFGKGISVLCSLLFTPYFIRELGIEYYGLIGFAITLLTIFSVLDLGVSQIFIKEMAAYRVSNTPKKEITNFVRSFEIFYWIGGVFFSLIFIGLSSFFANHWLCCEVINRDRILHCFYLLSVIILLQWPVPFYSGLFLSIDRQITLNVIILLTTLIKNLGIFFIFITFRSSIEIYFYVQLIANLFQMIAFICLVGSYFHFPYTWAVLSIKFNFFKRLKSSIFGMAGLSILTILLLNTDKVVLSKIISLENYGKYCLASSIASLMPIIATAFYQTFFPKIAGLVAAKDEIQLSQNYLRISTIIASLIIPITLGTYFFSEELIYVWTGDLTLSKGVAPILNILVVGMGINAIMIVPYILQISYGFLKPLFQQNLILIFLSAFFFYFVGEKWGAIGAAWVVITMNISYLYFNIRKMHQFFLKDLKKQWYLINLIPSAFIFAFLFSLKKINHFQKIPVILTIFMLCFLLSVLVLKFLNKRYTDKKIASTHING